MDEAQATCPTCGQSISNEQTTARTCLTCGKGLVWRPGEPRRDFLVRKYCNRRCWKWRPLPNWQERFWEKVEKGGPDECWLWTGARYDDNGYGAFMLNGRSRRAHIVVAEAFLGGKPPGQEVRHLCGVRACVNPAHLAWGSRHQNMQDMVRHGRSRARLTPQQVGEIRSRVASGETHAFLAREFGVSPATVDDLVARRTWRLLYG